MVAMGTGWREGEKEVGQNIQNSTYKINTRKVMWLTLPYDICYKNKSYRFSLQGEIFLLFLLYLYEKMDVS